MAKKNCSSMPVQAQAGEAQAAEGLWGVPRKKKSKIAVQAWGGGAQAASGPLAELQRAPDGEINHSSMLVQAECLEAQAARGFWGGPR
jgi:hypothetical protein